MTSLSRRPLTAEELPYLVRLGGALRELREGVGLSRRELGWAGELGVDQVGAIETAVRRTRRSTLTRLVEVLCSCDPGLGEVDDVVDDLCALAGPGLAAESVHAGRVARRRERRVRREDRMAKLVEQRARELNVVLHREFYKRARLEAEALVRAQNKRQERAK